MTTRTRCNWITVSAVCFSLVMCEAIGAPPKPRGVKAGIRKLLKIDQDYIAPLGGDDGALRPGLKVDVYLQSDKRLNDFEITELQAGKLKNSFKVLGGISSKGMKQKIQASTIVHVEVEEHGFDIVQDTTTKSFVALDLARRDEQARARLEANGNRLWDEPTEEERKATIAESKELFQRVKELFPDHDFELRETEFFLFFTDMPAQQIAGYVANLDTMYRQLCLAFGVQPGKNIWKGKCPVIAFLASESFRRFEIVEMKNADSLGAQGLHHGFDDGRVLIAVYRGDDPAYFATVLVHETAHGFVHRFRSNINVKSWIDEGIADWIAGVAVPASNAVARRQSDGVVFMRSHGTMGGFFDDDKKFDPTDYGIASHLTQFMVQTDPDLYRAFLMAIKDGYSIDDALKLIYDCTRGDLIRSFGASFGMPDLQP